jgi:putative ABC transport system permease protein
MRVRPSRALLSFRAPRRSRVLRVGLTQTRLGLRDGVDEALAGILARPARAVLTVLGTLLGVAAFVSVLGLTSSVSGQISQRFTVLSATEVTVADAADDSRLVGPAFPDDAERRAGRLNGVVTAGVYWEPKLPDGQQQVGVRFPDGPAGSAGAEPLTVLAASPGYLTAVHARLSAGRGYDDFHQRRAEPVCLLGAAAAHRLGITRVDGRQAIFVGQRPFTVIGIIDQVDRHRETLLSVVVPSSTAAAAWGAPDSADGRPARMVLETRIGAAQLVGSQIRYALRPDDPKRLAVTVPPDPQQLRQQVDGDLRTLFLGLAGICLLIGTLGIANTTLVSVLERVAEIGVRRSLGAQRRHIAAQFLIEAAVLGGLGGLVGTAFGIAVVVLIALARQWTPIIEPLAVYPAPLIGLLTGLVAGIYPAWRASRVEPVDALRR